MTPTHPLWSGADTSGSRNRRLEDSRIFPTLPALPTVVCRLTSSPRTGPAHRYPVLSAAEHHLVHPGQSIQENEAQIRLCLGGTPGLVPMAGRLDRQVQRLAGRHRCRQQRCRLQPGEVT